MDSGIDDAELVVSFADIEGLYFAERLETFHRRIARLAAEAAVLPWPDDDLLRTLEDKHEPSAVVASAEALAKVVSHRARHSAIPALVMQRPVAYLERFAASSIREILAARQGSSRQPEQLLQGEVDRFVFLEGLYPITHAKAGTGNLDSFIEETRPLFDAAERPGNAAILIELKQVAEHHHEGPCLS